MPFRLRSLSGEGQEGRPLLHLNGKLGLIEAFGGHHLRATHAVGHELGQDVFQARRVPRG